MNWDWIALMFMIIAVVATVGGVILLHPIAKRLGALLEAMTQERRKGDSPELERMMARIGRSLETFDERLSLLEERQDFTEDLLGRRQRQSLGGSESEHGGRTAPTEVSADRS